MKQARPSVRVVCPRRRSSGRLRGHGTANCGSDGTPSTTASEPTRLILATTTSTADSGLLDFILPDFEKVNNAKVDVIAVGTGQAIEIGSKGDADVLLVHSRKGEDKFVADGYAKERFDVMYNDFIIVGPRRIPAKIAGMAAGKDAFKAIMDAKAPFVSRGDKSGTNTKELSIWSSVRHHADEGDGLVQLPRARAWATRCSSPTRSRATP